MAVIVSVTVDLSVDGDESLVGLLVHKRGDLNSLLTIGDHIFTVNNNSLLEFLGHVNYEEERNNFGAGLGETFNGVV